MSHTHCLSWSVYAHASTQIPPVKAIPGYPTLAAARAAVRAKWEHDALKAAHLLPEETRTHKYAFVFKKTSV